jgi:hypothetical protein
MFGYITPVLNAMGDEQKSRYRSVYCGVCHSLLSRYGQAARLTLSNDMTFLAVLLDSLYEPEICIQPARCAVHPLHAHSFEQSAMVDFAADMNLILSYYKAADQVMDEEPAGKLAEKKLRNGFHLVRERHPRQAEEVREALDQLWAMEKESSPDPDALCNLSGRMLGAVFVPDPDDLWASVLYGIGESLGRFVYWMDAFDDFDADKKKRRFNPLTSYRSRPDYLAFCGDTLELFMAEAAERFEILPLEKDLDILRNVIYSGVWQRWIQLENKRNKKESSGKEECSNAEP